MNEQRLEYSAVPDRDRGDSFRRGEELFDNDRISLVECEVLLDLFAMAHRVAAVAARSLALTAERHGLEVMDVRDACEIVAFTYPIREDGLWFVVESGLVDWKGASQGEQSATPG